jgi:hypothetical protein
MRILRSDFPAQFVEETLRTIALLFPQANFTGSVQTTGRERTWLKKLCVAHRNLSRSIVDKRLTRCGTLQTDGRQIERFNFWRDRLIVLKEVYDDAKPTTLIQWWYDGRNGKQWYTFWVAILVLMVTTLFGVVQCVEGAVQVYKAYHPTT